LYQKVASSTQPSFLLESGKGENGNYSFFGSHPASVMPRPSLATASSSDDPFSWLRHIIASPGIERTPDLPPFFGGAVGCFSYDFARRLESVPAVAVDDLSLPDMHFALYEVVAAVDHRTNRIQVIFCPSLDRFLGEARDKLYREGLDRLAEWEARLTGSVATPPSPLALPTVSFGPQQTQEAYLDRVRRCQEYIAAGDIYQANLSHRFGIETPHGYRSGAARLQYEQALYQELRSVNPSPFSGLLRFGDMSLISCSPERLVRLQGRRADTRPIAGTRPRGCNSDDDRRLVRELLANEKERAEHVMLVDLERNDLGRICEIGSVQVNEFMAVEQYSHVSHTYRARCVPGRRLSISSAPRFRAGPSLVSRKFVVWRSLRNSSPFAADPIQDHSAISDGTGIWI
jgi:anthranilate/para-aminobenzoate synthase component I